jgi:hypothetical protein
MSNAVPPPSRQVVAAETPPDIGHPRGTLVIVLVFGALFGLAWFAMYLIRFLGQGAPHH